MIMYKNKLEKILSDLRIGKITVDLAHFRIMQIVEDLNNEINGDKVKNSNRDFMDDF